MILVIKEESPHGEFALRPCSLFCKIRCPGNAEGRSKKNLEVNTMQCNEIKFEGDSIMKKNSIMIMLMIIMVLISGCTARRGESNTITAAQAKSIALAQVPGAVEENIREFDVDQFEDGSLEYDGKIYYEGKEYSFEIDGYNGSIRSWEVEPIYE